MRRKDAVSSVISLFMVLMIISTSTAGILLWAVPTIEDKKASTASLSMVNKFSSLNEELNKIISPGNSGEIIKKVVLEEGSLDIDSNGDRFVTYYSFDKNYDFNVSGLDTNDGNKNDISIDMKKGTISEAKFYWLKDTCFLKGTQVLMADGSKKNIEDIMIGDTVVSYDFQNKNFCVSKVKQVFCHKPYEMADYYLKINGNLRVTPNHLFYSDGKWVYANDLKFGDQLFTGKSSEVCVIEDIKKIYSKAFTYDLEIEDKHNYFVSIEDYDVLVHNNDPPEEPIEPTPANESLNIQTEDLDLSWSECVDPDGDSVSYDVYFNISKSFSPTKDVLCENIDENQCSCDVLFSDTRYYWQVVARDSNDAESYSEIWWFETAGENTPPEISYHYPHNGSLDVETTPDCEFIISDDSDNLYYEIWENSSGVWILNTTGSNPLSGTEIIWEYTNADEYPEKYWWKVKVEDDDNLWTNNTYHFTTSSSPSIESLKGPWENSEDYIFYYNETSYTFSCKGSNPGANNMYYNFSWGDGTYSGWVVPNASGVVSKKVHSWNNAGTYKIRVKGMEDPNNDIQTDWSDPITINIKHKNVAPNNPEHRDKKELAASQDSLTYDTTEPLEGLVRIDLYDDSYPPSALHGSDVQGEIPFGQIWIFDLGCIKHSFQGKTNPRFTTLENGGVIVSHLSNHDLRECSNIFKISDELLIFKTTLIRGIETIGGYGSGIFKLKMLLGNTYMRSTENLNVYNFKVYISGKNNETWNSYLISPLRPYNFKYQTGNYEKTLVYNNGKKTGLVLSSSIIKINIEGIF